MGVPPQYPQPPRQPPEGYPPQGMPPQGYPPQGMPPARPPDFHDDVAATTASPLVKAAGGLQIAAGLLLALSGAQLLAVAKFTKPWMVRIPQAMLLVGVLALYMGYKILRTRAWAAVAGTVTNGLACLAMSYWVMATLASGFLSLLASLVPLVSLAGAIVGGIAIGPCLRAAEARRKLRESGIDMSF